jgi:uncharacterized protein (TIGR03118 family)
MVSTAHSAEVAAKNAYVQENFVANHARYKASLATDKRFINAWGIAIRPAGAGGHFWVTAKDVSFEYVGDVRTSPDAKLQKLHQDALKEITLPVGGDENFATGTVFSGSDTHFVITQEIKGKAPVTAPSKFLFASDGGMISAWTERKNADGSKDFPDHAIPVIDQSKDGAQFFGLALSHAYDRLYVADFGAKPEIKTFDGSFKPLAIAFDQPFDDNKNGKVDAGEYAPFNIQALTTPAGEQRLFVAYAKTRNCPKEAIKEGVCKAGDIFPGEEDIEKPGLGRIAEFSESGKLIAVWKDAGR